jgi:hypothetical protein
MKHEKTDVKELLVLSVWLLQSKVCHRLEQLSKLRSDRLIGISKSGFCSVGLLLSAF